MRFTRLFVFLFAALLVAVSAPITAQEALSTISVDGFSFSYDPSLASNVYIVPMRAEDLTDTFPTPAPHTRIILSNDDVNVPQGLYDAVGTIMIFDTADFNESQAAAFDSIQMMLAERPNLALYEGPQGNLVFLPEIAEGQMIRARSFYLDMETYSGIGFITKYGAAREPFTQENWLFTFQGVSSDGERYVSAIFPLTVGVLPAEPPAVEPEAFAANWDSYLMETVAQINRAEIDQFSPSLSAMEQVVNSFSF